MQFTLVGEWIACFPGYGKVRRCQALPYSGLLVNISNDWYMLLQQLNDFAVANQEFDLGNITPKSIIKVSLTPPFLSDLTYFMPL